MLNELNGDTNNKMTIHSADTSDDHYIRITEKTTNLFKNQLIFLVDFNVAETHEEVFPKFHRFIISKPQYSEEDIVHIIKEKVKINGTSCIHCPNSLIQLIQETYRKHFAENKIFKIYISLTLLTDIKSEVEQDDIVMKTHEYAHQGIKENKAQILSKYFFPSMDKKN